MSRFEFHHGWAKWTWVFGWWNMEWHATNMQTFVFMYQITKVKTLNGISWFLKRWCLHAFPVYIFNFLSYINFHFSIANGSVILLYGGNSYNRATKNYSDPLTDIPENKMAIIRCKKGFILSDRNKRKLFCQQGTWNLFFNESVGVSSKNDGNQQEELPECKRIICRRLPKILNAQPLPSVSKL